MSWRLPNASDCKFGQKHTIYNTDLRLYSMKYSLWLKFFPYTLTCLLGKYTRLTFWDIFVTLLTLFAAYLLNFLMIFFQPTHLLYVFTTLFSGKYLPKYHIEDLLSKFFHFFLYFAKKRKKWVDIPKSWLPHAYSLYFFPKKFHPTHLVGRLFAYSLNYFL